MTAPSSEELREAIAREEARVARLEDKRRLAQGRLDALRSALAALGAHASNRLIPVIPEPARPETSAEVEGHAGPVRRPAPPPPPGKTEVRIYDYVDRRVPLFQRMFEKRLRGYRAIGYARDDGPLTDDAGTGDAGTTETPATPISRKTRRPRSGRRVRKPSRAL